MLECFIMIYVGVFEMVGYAYSVDPSMGYGYFLIKCYDCDDISFIGSAAVYTAYRVSREDGSVEALIPSLTGGKRLRLKNIKEITELVTIAELEFDYPVVLTWAVNPSGICNALQTRELDTYFPVPISIARKNVSYISITPVLFSKPYSLLDVTFICKILNETAYLCGIFESEPFAVCGGEIFCSCTFAAGIKSLFAYDLFGDSVGNIAENIRVRKRFSKKKILSSINRLEFCRGNPQEDIPAVIRRCTEEIVHTVKDFMEGIIDNRRTLRRVSLCLFGAIGDIKSMSTQFLMRSGADSANDINYLTIEQLMSVMTFPISHTDTRRVIRTNKDRCRRYKAFDKPICICKGKLYYM